MNCERDLKFRNIDLSIETNPQYWLLRQDQLERAKLGINAVEEIKTRVKREQSKKVFVG